MIVDAVVLAGGQGRRLGGVSKPDVAVAGRTLLDRALDAVAGARHVVVVGPPHLGRPGVVTALEDPPFGGPLAGLHAGVVALGAAAADGADGADAGDAADVAVLVLACDVPGAASSVPALRAALAEHPGADGAQVVREGRPQPVALYRAARLRDALDGLAADGGLRGVPLRRLAERLRMTAVVDVQGHSDDADTWDDVARLESVLTRRDAMTAQTPADLDRWVAVVADALGVDAGALDRDLVLDLTRDVAHTVARPAVPLTTFLMGIAVGATGGDRAALDAAAATVARLTADWSADGGGA
ncbi:NTP transferase domain-containing protein [Cellulomonas sp. ATA003]|uniref:NTP transferase domain-containing protein n=1 Tax=Cellulomonas sp. ATA003 TaxID=3073064 RepID=UPI00287377B4|nr:NTP transferase domain-containing protein [Cellulomonas sp. ATA003]WNB86933.1 NTP transferase domain-containing protein [Cellulomonas sp. ATA003]